MKNEETLLKYIEENKSYLLTQIDKYINVYNTIDEYLLEKGINDTSQRQWMINDIINSVDFENYEKQQLNG